MEPGKIDVNITFDDNNQIRVLSADKFRETENLKNECIDFLKSKFQQKHQQLITSLLTLFYSFYRENVI